MAVGERPILASAGAVMPGIRRAWRLRMTLNGIRRVLLHGGRHESFDRSVRLAGRLVEGFGAELHVVYTIDEPLSAGWTAEVTPDRLPELHQAMAGEARGRLGGPLRPRPDNRVRPCRAGRGGDEAGHYRARD